MTRPDFTLPPLPPNPTLMNSHTILHTLDLLASTPYSPAPSTISSQSGIDDSPTSSASPTITTATSTTLVRAKPRTLTMTRAQPVPSLPSLNPAVVSARTEAGRDYLAVPPGGVFAPHPSKKRAKRVEVAEREVVGEPIISPSSLVPFLDKTGDGDETVREALWSAWEYLVEVDAEARLEVGKRRAQLVALERSICRLRNGGPGVGTVNTR